MFWGDRIAGEIEERFGKGRTLVIRDEKTPSGRVHIGSMRGVAIHGTVAEILTERGIPNEFVYEINDFDPMDGLPVYLPKETFERYMGQPLNTVPSPEEGAENYAEYFGTEFEKVIENAGWSPRFTRGSDLYQSGKMDELIKTALLRGDDIRRIYREVSGSQKEDEWLPISVVCPTCGKLSTTRADDFDGETVHVLCQERAVEWTHGCGFDGRVSPFGGAAKFPWKLEWPAKWKVYGVDIEGGGKDHSTKGGARDVANHISKEIFGYEPPFDMPYEFLLVGGKKMSSSKGAGSSAREIAMLVPTKILRLALLHKEINQQFNFDPEGDTIPVLYDLYDKLAAGYWGGEKSDDYARLFLYAHPKHEAPAERFLPRFSQVAFLVQMPHLDLEKEVSAMKGSALTSEDKKELIERAQYASRWLEAYAPEKFVFKLQDELPESAHSLSKEEKRALQIIASYLEEHADASGEDLHGKIHSLKDELSLEPKALFGAIYRSFLGKDHGPKAGWFLSVLPREFVLKRLKEASEA